MAAIEQVQERVLKHFGPDLEVGEIVTMRQTSYDSICNVSYTRLQR